MLSPQESHEKRLEQFEHRYHSTRFDSKVASWRSDGKMPTIPPKGKSEDIVDRLLSLMEDLGKRIDSLERKARNLSEELCLRDRRSRRRQSLIVAASLILSVLIAGAWATYTLKIIRF